MANHWPKDDEGALIAYYGTPKSAALESQLVPVIPPFRMTYAGKPIRSISFHKKAAPALRSALDEIWEAYGHDQAKIDAARVSVYSGAYNPRKISGSNRWSNHAFGAAIDLDAEHNGFNKGHGTMPQIVIDAFKRQGARWGGNYQHRTDPMHFEFCGGGEIVATADPKAPPAQSWPLPAGLTDEMHTRMAHAMVGYEAVRDKAKHVELFDPGDGTQEYAGINSRFHSATLAKIVPLVRAGKHDEAEKIAAEWMLDYTSVADSWFNDSGLEFYGRDCVLNRGPSGAGKIVQRALGFTGKDVDGDIGPESIAAIATREQDAGAFLVDLRKAREAYERTLPISNADKRLRDENWKKWAGMLNRWNNALNDARAFRGEQTANAPASTNDRQLVHGVLWVQQSLNKLLNPEAGSKRLDEDGKLGPETRRRIRAYQEEKGIEVTGIPDARTVERIEAALKPQTDAAPLATETHSVVADLRSKLASWFG